MPDEKRQRVPSGGQAGGYGGGVEGDGQTHATDKAQPYQQSPALDTNWIPVRDEDKHDQGGAMTELQRGWHGGRDKIPHDEIEDERPGE